MYPVNLLSGGIFLRLTPEYGAGQQDNFLRLCLSFPLFREQRGNQRHGERKSKRLPQQLPCQGGCAENHLRPRQPDGQGEHGSRKQHGTDEFQIREVMHREQRAALRFAFKYMDELRHHERKERRRPRLRQVAAEPQRRAERAKGAS